MNHYKEKPNGSYRGDNFVGVSKDKGVQFYSCERDYLDELEEDEEEEEDKTDIKDVKSLSDCGLYVITDNTGEKVEKSYALLGVSEPRFHNEESQIRRIINK